MKAPYIFSLLSPIVFKTAISFAFMTAAKREEEGRRRKTKNIFCHPDFKKECPHFSSQAFFSALNFSKSLLDQLTFNVMYVKLWLGW